MPAEPEIGVEDREQLVYLLSEAAELEHGLLCCYLFAAFSLKRQSDERLEPEELEAVMRWDRTISAVAAQEMLHLALVSNLLTSLGAAPHFTRPNFPVRRGYHPAGFHLSLEPFSAAAVQRFVAMEQPEWMYAEHHEAAHLRRRLASGEGRGAAIAQGFATIGHLYRGIEAGFRRLVERHGEAGVFIGPRRAQAVQSLLRFEGLAPVLDLDSAVAAIELIVEQGEGARGELEESHYSRFVGIAAELEQLTRRRPDFQPARPVVANPQSGRPPDAARGTQLTHPFTHRAAELFDASYEVMVMMLARFFAHENESDDELRTLVDAAIDLMFGVIRPLGRLLTTLPAHAAGGAPTAGPGFELGRTIHVLPHRHAAWMILGERCAELAGFAARLASELEGSDRGLERVATSLEDAVRKLARHSPAAIPGR